MAGIRNLTLVVAVAVFVGGQDDLRPNVEPLENNIAELADVTVNHDHDQVI